MVHVSILKMFKCRSYLPYYSNKRLIHISTDICRQAILDALFIKCYHNRLITYRDTIDR